jgi:6-pyruvoyltetrahydropterin/6-carboxytetrahydropterin synthase
MEKIIVTAKFHTGHRQLGYPGKCKFVHGHTWQGKVVVAAEEFPRDHLDMSLDFGDIKDVIRFMDHKMLITDEDKTFLDQGLFGPEGVVLLKGKGPSVENVAQYVFDGVVGLIEKQYPGRGIRYAIEVTIQETENNIFIIEKTVAV